MAFVRQAPPTQAVLAEAELDDAATRVRSWVATQIARCRQMNAERERSAQPFRLSDNMLALRQVIAAYDAERNDNARMRAILERLALNAHESHASAFDFRSCPHHSCSKLREAISPARPTLVGQLGLTDRVRPNQLLSN